MASSPPSSPQFPLEPRNGVFEDNVWRCNCTPRRNAVLRRVKKNSENTGRKFYGCSTSIKKGNPCDMFILEEDAQRYVDKYFTTNDGSKKRQTTLHETMTPRKGKETSGKTTHLTKNDGHQAATTSQSRSFAKSSATNKTSTMRNDGGDTPARPDRFYDATSGEDEMHPFDELSSDCAEGLVAATEQSSKMCSARSRHEQPDALITPSVVRTTDMENGLPTPSLTTQSVNRRLFEGPKGAASATSPKRQRLEDSTATAPGPSRAPPTLTRIFGADTTIDTGTSTLLPSPLHRPSPQPRSSPPPNSSTGAAALTSEVMDLLKDENVTPAVRSAVRRVLERHVNLARGYERGRNAARTSAKEAEDRCARLQARVDDLERSRQQLRTDLMDMWNRA